jgi:hypothetical protein
MMMSTIERKSEERSGYGKTLNRKLKLKLKLLVEDKQIAEESGYGVDEVYRTLPNGERAPAFGGACLHCEE